MAKLYSSRIIPTDERILIRVAGSAAKRLALVIAEPNPLTGKVEVSDAQQSKRKNCGIVVAVGPGQRSSISGERIPIDPNITPGAEVHFEVSQGVHVPHRPPAMAEEMEEEGLYFILESAIICVLRPAGVDARRAVLA